MTHDKTPKYGQQPQHNNGDDMHVKQGPGTGEPDKSENEAKERRKTQRGVDGVMKPED